MWASPGLQQFPKICTCPLMPALSLYLSLFLSRQSACAEHTKCDVLTAVLLLRRSASFASSFLRTPSSRRPLRPFWVSNRSGALHVCRASLLVAECGPVCRVIPSPEMSGAPLVRSLTIEKILKMMHLTIRPSGAQARARHFSASGTYLLFNFFG